MAGKNDVGVNFLNLLDPLRGLGFAIAVEGIGGKCMTSVKLGVTTPSFHKRWQASKEMLVLKTQYRVRATSRGLRHFAESRRAARVLVIPNREIMIVNGGEDGSIMAGRVGTTPPRLDGGELGDHDQRVNLRDRVLR